MQSVNRLISIDVFRGITIAGMIIVNNPGSMDIYPFLTHGRWNQWTLTDLVFPFFLFIVGAVIPFSLASRQSSFTERRKLYLHIVKRTILLFGLGLVINSFPYFYLSRIPGVLQRIALCYFFATITTVRLRARGVAVTAVVLLLLYWLLMKLVPVPGYGAGVLTRQGNLAFYIDNLLMHGHLLEPSWDPEGLLSTIPAISTTLIGVLSGHLLRSQMGHRDKVVLLLMFGIGGIAAGLIMDIWFPINKNLWSPSYAVFTAGIALCCLSICYWLIDAKGHQRWCFPFMIYGTNAISVYVLSSIVARAIYLKALNLSDGSVVGLKDYIFNKFFASWASPFNASLFYALTYALIWLGFAWFLYRKKIIIKI
ncbi:DUF5009 domain-containing protein [candidate division WS5 bacterium]|uniref:DUF5009 domain-containing protein n=1 Tax=candidate division WS5 bacterium TaxID=2093353 RepID=A0A419DC59_9BACT|nr:MAG: DUF5009 domain-containing protein [candidate division WS5 bacterium]